MTEAEMGPEMLQDEPLRPTPAAALVENPDEPVEGTDDLPDEVRDGDAAADETPEEGE